MKRAFRIALPLLSILLVLAFAGMDAIAQIPGKCLEIESILVDACVPGGGCTSVASPNCNCEGKNEMVRFRVGGTPIATADITITWPSNSYKGISPKNATTDSLVAILQATVQSPCGLLTQPINDTLPAGATVLLITSTDMCTNANSFTNLNDTLYVIFQNSGNFAGHFANYNSTPGFRSLIMGLISSGCRDTATYDRSQLVNINGNVGGSTSAQDGSTVEFSWAGTPTYINRGCQAPFVPFDINISSVSSLGQNVVCRNDTILITAISIGSSISSINWSVHDVNGQTINAGNFFNASGNTIEIATSANNIQSFYVIASASDPCATIIKDSVLIDVRNIPDLNVTASGPLSFCQGDSVTLNSSVSSVLASTFSWNNGITNPSLTVYTSDTLWATATNVCGDSISGVFITEARPLPVSDAGSDAVYCSGDSVQIGTANTVGYTYLWNNGNGLSDSTISNPVVSLNNSSQNQLSQTYVVFSILNACVTSDTVNVTVNPLPVWTAGPDISVCSANAVATLGISPNTNYSYSWTPTSLLTSADTVANPTTILLSNDSNQFNVEVSYFGCTINDSMYVFVAPTPSSDAGIDKAYCSGDSVQIGATAVANYTYQWAAGSGLSDSLISSPYVILSNSTQLPQTTTYIVTTTLNNCSSTDTVSVTVNPLPVWDAGSDIVVCSTNPVATIGSTPNPAYTYSWSPSSDINGSSAIANPTTISLTNSVNSFNVVVSLSSCSVADSMKVFVLDAPVAIAGNDTAICSGASIPLGTANNSSYSYAWNNTGALNDTTLSNPLFTLNNSTTGDITQQMVVLTTINGTSCQSTDTVVVTVHAIPVPVVNASGTTTICAGDSVTLTSSVASAYSWSNGSANQSITVSNAGVYSVTVIDANGCQGISSDVTVTVNALPTIVASNDGPKCVGQSVSLTASGTGNMTWAGPNSYTATGSSVIINNASLTDAGDYIVNITDVNGCVNSDTTTVVVNNNPAPVITASGPLTFCQGGSVILSSNYPTGNSWTGGSSNTNVTVSSGNNYSLTVTDANGCTGTSSPVTVVVNPLPVADINPSGPVINICSGSSTTLTATAASAYLWSNGMTSPSITVSTTGSYTVVITDANGCVSQPSNVVSINVLNPIPPTITANGPLSICNGQSVTLTSSSTNNNTWSNGETTNSITVTQAGPYSVTASDVNGCMAQSASVNISIQAAIPPVISANSVLMVCDGHAVTLTSNASTGNVWSTGNTSQSITIDQSGTYSVSAPDVNGCIAQASVVVTNAPAPLADFNVSPQTGMMPLQVTITNNSINNSENLWNFGNGLTSDLEDPAAVTYSGVGSFSILLTVKNELGCSDTLTKVVVVESEIPNVFSPNNDKHNDEFRIPLGGLAQYSIAIFNRWGEEVFASNDINQSWDGQNKSGKQSETGVYYYLIKYTTLSGENKEAMGYVSLVR